MRDQYILLDKVLRIRNSLADILREKFEPVMLCGPQRVIRNANA